MPHRSPITTVDHHLGTCFRVSGGYDGRVVGWNSDGTERWSTDFDDLVNDVRIDPSGAGVAVAVADRYAYVLDAVSGARTAKFGPHGDDVNAVRWSPDGSRIACVMDHLDTTIHVWTLGSDRAAEHTLTGHESGVFAVAFDATGTRLATVAEDSTARIWDLATSSQLHVLRHPGDPEALDWAPDGSVVVTGCDDGICRVWDPNTGALVAELADASAAVRFVRFHPDSTRVMVGSYDATMRIYDCSTWTVIESLTADYQWERAGSFANDGVIIGSFGGAPIEHPAATPSLPMTLGINALAVRDGHVFVGRDDGGVLRDGTVLTTHPTIVNSVALSPDGTVAVSGDYRGGVHIVSLLTGSVTVMRAEDGGPINSISWHPSGGRFFSGGYDGKVREWTPSGECLRTHVAHHGPIKSLAWSAAASLLVCGSSDGSLSAWKGSEEQWRASADDLVLVNAVACADAAGQVVTSSRDLRVRVWDAGTGALLETLGAGHTKSLKAIAVNSDASMILTGSYDGTAIIWTRNNSGAWSWRPLRLHGKPGVPAVAISGERLYTAGWNGSVGVWAPNGVLVEELLRG